MDREQPSEHTRFGAFKNSWRTVMIRKLNEQRARLQMRPLAPSEFDAIKVSEIEDSYNELVKKPTPSPLPTQMDLLGLPQSRKL